MDEEKIDYVNHPPHYQSKKGMEVIDVIEDFTEGLEGVEATVKGYYLAGKISRADLDCIFRKYGIL